VPHTIDISLRFALDEQFLQIFKPAVCEGDDLLFVGSIDPETAVFWLHVDCKVSQQLLVLAEDLSEMRDSEYVSWLRYGPCSTSSGGVIHAAGATPVPWQQRCQISDLVISNPCQHVGKPSLLIKLIELAGLNERAHDSGALSTAIGAGEEPRLQRAFGGIVAQANPTVIENRRLAATAKCFRSPHQNGCSLPKSTRQNGPRLSQSRRQQ